MSSGAESDDAESRDAESNDGEPARRPTLEEYRSVAQPPEIRSRKSSEHWVADLYLRRISPRVSYPLARAGLSANAVTGLMIAAGAAAGAALLVPGIPGVVISAGLGQLQMLLDCCDGEIARWRRTFSPAGIFLDKVGHYVAESVIPLALGVRAAGGIGETGTWGWQLLGALLALLVVLNKALNDMVHVARAFSGLDRMPEDPAATRPRGGVLSRIRQVARFVPFHRIFHSVELTLLALLATLVGFVVEGDGGAGGVIGTRWLLAGLVPLAALTVVGHVVAILASSRLRRTA